MMQEPIKKVQVGNPWGDGYTPELEAFERWLIARGREDHMLSPSGYAAEVVNSIMRGGSRVLWYEYKDEGSPELKAWREQRSMAHLKESRTKDDYRAKVLALVPKQSRQKLLFELQRNERRAMQSDLWLNAIAELEQDGESTETHSQAS